MSRSILRFFQYGHLPPRLQYAARPFHDLAHRAHQNYHRSDECEVVLRKLLEAKDAAVRAALDVATIGTEAESDNPIDAAQRDFHSMALSMKRLSDWRERLIKDNKSGAEDEAQKGG